MARKRKPTSNEIRNRVVALQDAISRAYAQFDMELPALQKSCPHEHVTSFHTYDAPMYKCLDCHLESRTPFGRRPH